MNNLSWFLYLTEVLNSFGTFLSIVGVFSLIAFGLTVFFITVENSSYYRKEKLPYPKKIYFFSALASIGLATFFPAKETMYAIAASEMGEEVLKSETANKAQQALNAWLDEQIKSAKKESE